MELKVFSFGDGLSEEAQGEGGTMRGRFEEFRPTQVGRRLRRQRDQSGSQHGQVRIVVPVFEAGPVLGPEGVAHPVIADFAAAPVAPDRLREVRRRSRSPTAQVIRDGFLIGRPGAGTGLAHHDQAPHQGQVHFQRVQGEEFDAARVQPFVAQV